MDSPIVTMSLLLFELYTGSLFMSICVSNKQFSCTKHAETIYLPTYLLYSHTLQFCSRPLLSPLSICWKVCCSWYSSCLWPAVIYCRRSLHLEFLTTSCPQFSHRGYLSL